MENESVWLGPMRQPIKLLMYLSVATAAIIGAYLTVSAHFLGGEVGMHEMLRPEGRTEVLAMLWALLASFVFASLFLSDTIGAIEPKPAGFFDWISLICSRLAMIWVVLIVLVMFYEVVARYVFERPTLWANELSLWMAGFVFLFAGLYAMQQRSHIRIYIIYDLMPRGMQKLSDCVSVALIWLFAISLVWGGYNEAVQKFMRMEAFGTAWDPPIPATIKPGILIIISLVAIQALSNLIADWHKAPEHHSPADEIDETEIENIRRALKED
ncbi:hypothetical protein LNKW23_33830 [Paralimibaculum aggregatum]|uniref:TRAP transporter small permease protein n=1 Tax=Paralimibaculum aggregatum TaxID=3036245 RepID=A0ABQ6LLS8_9RHOB|nr:TRAP transporter small permease [Limibaculum sp. NKW23]GMG84169.1 hypothetical protein LNKW23_33830 [Limibaculum sp. NKW23]